MSTAKVFLDTAYAIALSSPRDEHHQKAVELAEHLETNGTKLVTTRAVVLEIGNALAKQRYRAAAVALLQALEQDANIEIVPLAEDVYERGFKLFQQREDKEWGLTDCLSFVIMQEHGLNEALTTDEHFEQAGFRTLLKDM
jgi:predicted nucleic acid-binding protein